MAEKKKIKCHLCGNKWMTKTDKMFVTCTNCQRKTPVKENQKEVKQ